MSEAFPNFEVLLREALSPVDPPDDLTLRLEGALTSLTELAAGELESWELSAMRDPRNWARPAAAVVVGGTAGVALVLLRSRRRGRSGGVRHAAGHALRELGELGGDTRGLVGRVARELGEDARRIRDQ